MKRIPILTLFVALLLPGIGHSAPKLAGVHPAIDRGLALAAREPLVKAARSFSERVLRPTDDDLRVLVEYRQEIGAADRRAMSAVGTVEVVLDSRAQVLISRHQLDALANLRGVSRVRWPRVPTKKSTSEGLSPMGITNWHEAGRTGEDVTVGILDSDFEGYDAVGDALPTFTEDQYSWAPSLGGPDEGKHGTACAEIIHEIAPGAELYLANFGTELEYETQIQWLIDQGSDIISASIGWDNYYPMDGTSQLVQVVEAASTGGVLYIGAAGNEGEQYWTGTWADANGDNELDFLAGSYEGTLPIFINDWDFEDPAEYGVVVRWMEPFGSAAIDLDIKLYIASLSDPTVSIQELGESSETQDGSGDPVEWINSAEVTVPADHGVFASVRWYGEGSGDPTGLEVKVFANSGPEDTLPAEYQVRDGSLTAPADAPSCLAVGAVQHSDLAITRYSSEGPTDDGRSKPDLFGISHVSTESYGAFADDEGEPGFNGTSAATPHVAGAAALIWASVPGADRASVWAALMDAVDTTVITGGGNTAGSGLVVLPPLPSGDDDDSSASGDDDDDSSASDDDDDDSSASDDDDDDSSASDDDDDDDDGRASGCSGCSTLPGQLAGADAAPTSGGNASPLTGLAAALIGGLALVRRRRRNLG